MGKVTAIIVAAGTGSRMGTQPVPKQFLRIKGVPILTYTLQKFDNASAIDQIVLVTRAEDRGACEELIVAGGVKKVDAIVAGGKERQDSVFYGLRQADPQTEIVLIHDAVRMFVTEDIIVASIASARKYGVSVTAVPAKDTIKKVIVHREDKDELFVAETLNRKELWQTQTPQTFQYPLILSFHQQAQELGVYGTDDAMLAEYFGHPVHIVYGSYRNIKITTPDDLLIAQAFLQDEKRHVTTP